MTRPTLFGHLATRFGSQPDLLATEAMAYLLSASPAVRETVTEICAVAAKGLPEELQFRAVPHSASGGIPTLHGLDGGGATRIVLDARFWSALHDEQPVGLLRQLTPDQDGVLLMLAPASRFTPLWAELRRRCRSADLPVHSDRAAGTPVRWTRTGPHQSLVLASWLVLLAGARSRLEAAGDRQTLAEVDQLAGLCEQMDSDTFLPLGPGEIAAISARRLAQLYRLVDELVNACVARRLGSAIEDDGGTTEPGQFGRRLRLGVVTLSVCLSVDRWATLRETPFWVQIYDSEGRPARGMDARLEPLASEIPPRLLREASTGCPLVPLFPPVGVDRAAVLDDLVRQVEEVARLLGESPTTGFGSPA